MDDSGLTCSRNESVDRAGRFDRQRARWFRARTALPRNLAKTLNKLPKSLADLRIGRIAPKTGGNLGSSFKLERPL